MYQCPAAPGSACWAALLVDRIFFLRSVLVLSYFLSCFFHLNNLITEIVIAVVGIIADLRPDAVLDDGVIVLPLENLLKPLFYFFLHAAFFLLCRFCSCSVRCVINIPTDLLSLVASCFNILYVDTRTATDLNFIVSKLSCLSDIELRLTVNNLL